VDLQNNFRCEFLLFLCFCSSKGHDLKFQERKLKCQQKIPRKKIEVPANVKDGDQSSAKREKEREGRKREKERGGEREKGEREREVCVVLELCV